MQMTIDLPEGWMPGPDAPEICCALHAVKSGRADHPPYMHVPLLYDDETAAAARRRVERELQDRPARGPAHSTSDQ